MRFDFCLFSHLLFFGLLASYWTECLEQVDTFLSKCSPLALSVFDVICKAIVVSLVDWSGEESSKVEILPSDFLSLWQHFWHVCLFIITWPTLWKYRPPAVLVDPESISTSRLTLKAATNAPLPPLSGRENSELSCHLVTSRLESCWLYAK